MFAAANAYLPVRKRDNNFHFTAQAYAASEADDDFRGLCGAALANETAADLSSCVDGLHHQTRAFIAAACFPGAARVPEVPPRRCPPPPSIPGGGGGGGGVLVYTRALYEQPFLAPFVEWHARLGVGCFLVLHTDSDPLLIPPHHGGGGTSTAPSDGFGDGRVLVHDVPNSGNSVLWAFDYLVRAQREVGYEWVLAIDVDEYLLLAPRFGGGIVDFIRQKEEEEEERASSAMVIDAFQFACELHSYLYFFIIFIP